MNEAAVDLVSQALQNGVPAQYVLFDSWYSSPKMFDLINQLGLDGVGMLKRPWLVLRPLWTQLLKCSQAM